MPDIGNGLFPATVMNVKPIKLDAPDQFGKTDKLEIDLDVEVEGDVVELNPRVNVAWSERATLFKVAQAAGFDPNPFESFDAETLVGRRLNVLIEQEEGKWPRVTTWSRIPTRKLTRRTGTGDPGGAQYVPAGPDVDPDDLPFE
jgi:hypothetical protein